MKHDEPVEDEFTDEYYDPTIAVVEDPQRDRPTLPVPGLSPIRIALVKIAFTAIKSERVLADLSRDPRSEICYERPSGPAVSLSATSEDEELTG